MPIRKDKQHSEATWGTEDVESSYHPGSDCDSDTCPLHLDADAGNLLWQFRMLRLPQEQLLLIDSARSRWWSWPRLYHIEVPVLLEEACSEDTANLVRWHSYPWQYLGCVEGSCGGWRFREVRPVHRIPGRRIKDGPRSHISIKQVRRLTSSWAATLQNSQAGGKPASILSA